MTQKMKYYERIKNNTKDVRFNDLVNILKEFGFELKRTSGSHNVFSRNEITFAIPSHNN
jgi:predicted RNA binding protein YcfA (HicA-like mRNA interferase family)